MQPGFRKMVRAMRHEQENKTLREALEGLLQCAEPIGRELAAGVDVPAQSSLHDACITARKAISRTRAGGGDDVY